MRYLFLPLLCLFTASCFYVSAPPLHRLGDSKPEEYWPTTPGTVWLYEWKDSQKAFVHEITEVDEDAGVKTISMKVVDEDKHVSREEYKLSPQGLFLTNHYGTQLEWPVCMLKFPLRDREVWRNRVPECMKYTTMSPGGDQCMTNNGRELIVVPAGIFWAVRVDCVDPVRLLCFNGAPWSGVSTTWYASGVGVVKHKVENSEYVLKSFTPGKAQAPTSPPAR